MPYFPKSLITIDTFMEDLQLQSESVFHGCAIADGHLHHKSVSGVFLRCDFRKVSFECCEFKNAMFWRCTFSHSNFMQTSILSCQFYECSFVDCTFSGSMSQLLCQGTNVDVYCVTFSEQKIPDGSTNSVSAVT